MQDDLLTSEIKKNNNSFFVSKELEDVLLSENLISKSNCLLNVDNVSIECSVLSYKVCSKKIIKI